MTVLVIFSCFLVYSHVFSFIDYRRAHRLTVLVIFSCFLVYVALFEDVKVDVEYNTKR